jgi:hypothetical protein
VAPGTRGPGLTPTSRATYETPQDRGATRRKARWQAERRLAPCALAMRAQHPAGGREVAGSNPVSPMNFRTRDPREIRAKDAKMLDSRGRCSLVFVGVRGTRDRRRTAAVAETDSKWTAALSRLEPAAGERYIGLRDDRAFIVDPRPCVWAHGEQAGNKNLENLRFASAAVPTLRCAAPRRQPIARPSLLTLRPGNPPARGCRTAVETEPIIRPTGTVSIE